MVNVVTSKTIFQPNTKTSQMKLIPTSIFVALGSLSVFGQQAKLTATKTVLAPEGGSIKFTATATYDERPGALGWSISLPAGWSLRRTGGPNVPDISPIASNSGKLEWAFIAAPASPAQFDFVLRYPANSSPSNNIQAELLLCTNGKTTVVPANHLVLRQLPARPELQP